MRKTSGPCFHFSWTGRKGQRASDLCNQRRPTPKQRCGSDIRTSGLICLGSHPLLILPASEQPPGRTLVEARPRLPLIKPKAHILSLHAPNFDHRCLVFNKEQVIQKDRSSEFILPLIPAVATCCVCCQWYWWPCLVSCVQLGGSSSLASLFL